MGDLCGRPPKLEHNDETGEVQYFVWNFYALARDAVMVDEEDACNHTRCSNKVPGLSSAVVPTPHAVTLVTTERSAERICNLTNEYQSPSHAVGQLDHKVVEHQHVREPHAGAEVVQNVPHAKCKPSWIRQLLRIITIRLVLVCKQGLLTVFLPCNSPFRHPAQIGHELLKVTQSHKMANSQNKFTNDGSFLEQFRKLQEQKQADKSKVNDAHSVPTVKHLKPIVGRMGSQKRKVPLKQSVKTVHKAFQDDSDSEEDERNASKECPEDRGPSKRQSEGQPCAGTS